MPAVGADNEVGMNFKIAVRSLGPQAHDLVSIEQQIIDVGAHMQSEARIALGMVDE